MIQVQLKLKLAPRQERQLNHWLYHLAAVWNWLSCYTGKMQPINMLGRKCGRLTVIEAAGVLNGQLAWLCLCKCGTRVVVRGFPLRAGTIQSCGCYAADQSRIRWSKHGKSRDVIYLILRAARQRAKLKSLPFNLALEDLPESLPKRCPVLGILIKSNVGGRSTKPASPSLDRIIPSLGYVKGNVRIISHRANELKSNASIDELKLILKDAKRIAGAGMALERKVA